MKKLLDIILLGMLVSILTVSAEASFAVRDIEVQNLTAGSFTNITVIFTNDNINQALALQDIIPEGWSLTRISDDSSIYKASTNEWIWFNVGAGAAKTVVYRLDVPANATPEIYNIFGSVINSSGIIAIVTGEYSVNVISTPIVVGIDTVGIYRNGSFYLRNSNDAGNANLSFVYGMDGDIPLVSDWDGDGVDTVGIYRSGAFYLRNSNSGGNADLSFVYGMYGDTPLVGDWDNDGIDTVGIYRNGAYYLRNSNSAGNADLSFVYGVDGDTPLVGDWNNDGTDTVGIYRNGAYYLRNSNSAGNADLSFVYGVDGDTPLVGDWNGEGTDTVGIYRNGAYHLRNSNSGGNADLSFVYGMYGDTPITGDWDGQ